MRLEKKLTFDASAFLLSEFDDVGDDVVWIVGDFELVIVDDADFDGGADDFPDA